MIRIFILAATALTLATPATAGTIALINTGAAGSGVDAHWTVNGGNAYANTVMWPIAPFGPWMANNGTSRWIQPTPVTNQSLDPAVNGLYTYTTQFNLTGFNPATARFTGRYAADNFVTSIKLNGTTILSVAPNGTNQFQQWQNYSANSGFVAGLNTLSFTVVKYRNATGNPTGFRAEFLSSSVAAVPEPSSWAMMILGVGFAGAALRRRRALAMA